MDLEINRRTFALMLGSASLLNAADPWKEKKAAEFTPEDVQKLASKSPWSKEATVSMQMPTGGPSGGGGGGRGGGGGAGAGGGGGMAGGGGGGKGGGGGRGGGGGGEGGGGAGGGGGMGGGMPQIKVTVRWESAQMIIDASKRQRSKEAQSYYILSVTGLPMMGQGRGRPGQEKKGEGATVASPEERRNAMVARFKESTMLERKGKDPIYPERVEILEGNSARLVVFLFPKEGADIAMGDKEVTFHSKMVAMDLKARFSLKEMMYEGKLEL